VHHPCPQIVKYLLNNDVMLVLNALKDITQEGAAARKKQEGS
jgi:hypothetical protein